jgi:hypothetical protein
VLIILVNILFNRFQSLLKEVLKLGVNEPESTVNRALDGSTNPGLKLVLSSVCEKNVIVKKCNSL